jgi:succinate dehydrogenase / fumarate reductase flavoprotein subunit/fumarate reductase (CoM/CoB) subunit A
MNEIIILKTDVLVAGAGAAGMFAAIAAARTGARVILLDKNVVGRGGASIMAQMTCAAALGEVEPDGPELHLKDTIEAGRGLCNEGLSALLCEGSPKRIRELESWKVNWARQENGRINQVKAPGHGRKRCVYVDFLSTGAAICAVLRNKVSRNSNIRRLSNVTLTDVVMRHGEAVGAVGFDVATTTPVLIKASAVVLALGGMTKMFRRTTSPNNLAGEGIGIALRAGAQLIDMEFLQFYPNGHLAPRMVGLDPTTWEPTRVKLGGRLLNGNGDEFLHNYGEAQEPGYNTARDTLTYAIYKEVEAGRGSPHGGVYLSFRHLDNALLAAALGPVIDIFKRNNIDLTRQAVEVSPIAHYQMGGVEVTTGMETRVPGLYAAGELAGGANGANRLSGNALPEALVFGERAGEQAARFASRNIGPDWEQAAAEEQIELIRSTRGRNAGRGPSPALLMSELKELMWRKAGPFRTVSGLADALERIRTMRERDLQVAAVSSDSVHNASLVEWFELRNGLYSAEALALSALNRPESRGAHQRSDFPQTRAEYEINQCIRLDHGRLVSSFAAVETQATVQAVRV